MTEFLAWLESTRKELNPESYRELNHPQNRTPASSLPSPSVQECGRFAGEPSALEDALGGFAGVQPVGAAGRCVTNTLLRPLQPGLTPTPAPLAGEGGPRDFTISSLREQGP